MARPYRIAYAVSHFAMVASFLVAMAALYCCMLRHSLSVHAAIILLYSGLAGMIAGHWFNGRVLARELDARKKI